MSNVAIDLTKTVKEIITTMKTAIDNLNTDVSSNKTAIDNLNTDVSSNKTAIDNLNTDVSSNKTAIDNLNTDVSSNKTAIDNLKGQILQAVYPVGSVYVSITDSRNPANILGFGTWEALPAGYGLVAQGTATAEDGSTLTFTAGQKSGEFKHQITVGELPTESPYGILSVTQDRGLTAAAAVKGGYYEGRLVVTGDDKKVSHGGGKRIDSISPAVGAYLWHRTV